MPDPVPCAQPLRQAARMIRDPRNTELEFVFIGFLMAIALGYPLAGLILPLIGT